MEILAVHLLHNRKALMELPTEKSHIILRDCNNEFRNDKEFVMNRMSDIFDFRAWQYISDELKNDREVALMAVKNSDSVYGLGTNWNFANDEDFTKKAIRLNGNWLYYADTELKNDKAFIMHEINNGTLKSLDDASEQIKDDKEVALAVVKKDHWAFTSVSKRLHGDKEVVLEAVKGDPDLGRHASKEIRKLIGDNDPVKVLQSAVLQEKLSAQLKPKSAQTERTMKI